MSVIIRAHALTDSEIATGPAQLHVLQISNESYNMPMTSLFRRPPGEHDIQRARGFLAKLTDYLKVDQPGFYQRYSDLRRIKVDKRMHAALKHLGCTRKSFARHKVLIVDDIFLHLEIVDDLTACDGFHFVFCEPSALKVTESETDSADETGSRIAS